MKKFSSVDLSKILKPYENQWVALSEDYRLVLGAGKTLQQAEKQAQLSGKRFLFVKLQPFDAAYVPSEQ
jgi:hypothetical protein